LQQFSAGNAVTAAAWFAQDGQHGMALKWPAARGGTLHFNVDLS
jgi:hypothetical protein